MKKIKLSILTLICFLIFISSDIFANESKWEGVDAKVVEKYAKMYGREPKEPIINTDQGDLLLFIFTLFGAIGGFVAGYNYRRLFKEKKGDICARV
ncbi:MAG: cobalt ABC transporter permease [Proteobacteria bacterium]|nr:cobalt ABC transporter permease [Pseudomonadota bacterium]